MKILFPFFFSVISTISLSQAAEYTAVDTNSLDHSSHEAHAESTVSKTTKKSVHKSKKHKHIQAKHHSNDNANSEHHVKYSDQVMLKLKYGEIDRSKVSSISSMGFSSLSNKLSELEKSGIFKIHSEPSLISLSGQTASFSSGGQIAIPLYDNGNVKSVQYKSYGISLSFTPKVIDKNTIRLSIEHENVEPENLSKSSNPNFKASHTQTTVELAPGESFMISGLLSDKENYNKNKSLFELLSPGYVSEQKEVVVVVTPYFVKPVHSTAITMPTDKFDMKTEIDSMIKNRAGSFFKKSDL